MKALIALTMLTAALLAAPAQADDEAIAAAKDAARSWLALIDSGNYAKGWEEAASIFQSSVGSAGWEKAVEAARSPLGDVKSRSVRSVTYTHEVPGAPDGEYVVLRFDTEFENQASAIETVTPMKDTDGTWRVSGYFIK